MHLTDRANSSRVQGRFDSLPIELVQETLRFLTPWTSNSSLLRDVQLYHSTLQDLRLVCKQWTHAVDTDPWFWSIISTYISAAARQTFLSRSRSGKLYIAADLQLSFWESAAQVAAHRAFAVDVLPHSHRWQVLLIDTGTWHAWMTKLLTCNWASLEMLSVRCISPAQPVDPGSEVDILGGGERTNLKDITLYCFDIPYREKSIFSRLESLTVFAEETGTFRSLPGAELMELLAAMPLLERLALHYGIGHTQANPLTNQDLCPDSIILGMRPLPRLTWLAATAVPGVVVALILSSSKETMEHISLSIPWSDASTTVSLVRLFGQRACWGDELAVHAYGTFLRIEGINDTASLSLTLPSNGIQDSLVEQVMRNLFETIASEARRQIKTLATNFDINYAPLSRETFALIDRQCPSVQRWSVLGKQLGDSIVSILGGWDSSSSLFPHLETLWVDSGAEVGPQCLLDAVRNRVTAGLPIQELTCFAHHLSKEADDELRHLVARVTVVGTRWS